MITKDYIEDIKTQNRQELYNLLREPTDNGSTLFLLEHLGRLPRDFDGEVFVNLISNVDDRVRL